MEAGVSVADLVDPKDLPPCVPRAVFDSCVETFQALAYLSNRPSRIDENRLRVGITWSSSLMCKLQAAEAGQQLIVVPLGLIARVYTLALVLEAHDGSLPVHFVGDESELTRILATPARLAAIFIRSDDTGDFWKRLEHIQESFGLKTMDSFEAARVTALLSTAFFVCHEIGHWVRMHDLVGPSLSAGDEVGQGQISLSDLRRGIELSADVSGIEALTIFITQYPPPLLKTRSMADRWTDLLYAVATGFSLFEIHQHGIFGSAPRVYDDPVIRHQICIDACELTVGANWAGAVEDWRTAERRAWLRYIERFGALQAASVAGRYGTGRGDELTAPYNVLGRSGSPELTDILIASRQLHDRTVTTVNSIHQSLRSDEFDPRFDDGLFHHGIETVPSCSVGSCLVRRWKAGEAGPHRLGAAFVSAIVDVRRSGYTGNITPDDLRALCWYYLPDEIVSVTEATYAAEMDWATSRIGGVTSCISFVSFQSFEVDPALIEAEKREYSGRVVPKQVWQWLLTHVDNSDDLLCVAAHAAWQRDIDIADEALKKIERGGDRAGIVATWRAMLAELRGDTAEQITSHESTARVDTEAGLTRLALLHLRAGNLNEAEALLRPLATDEHPGAMSNMGLVEERRGRPESARRWWVKAASAGDSRAMNNLAQIALTDGDPAEAQQWCAAAAEAGDLLGMYNMGALSQMQDNATDAEMWWRIAADSGSTDAMVELGQLLLAQGRVDEASRWWSHTAAVAGQQLVDDPTLRDERLALGETLKQWDARVDDAREIGSLRNYGILLAMSGDTTKAVAMLDQARHGGDIEAERYLNAIAASMTSGSDEVER